MASVLYVPPSLNPVTVKYYKASRNTWTTGEYTPLLVTSRSYTGVDGPLSGNMVAVWYQDSLLRADTKVCWNWDNSPTEAELRLALEAVVKARSYGTIFGSGFPLPFPPLREGDPFYAKDNQRCRGAHACFGFFDDIANVTQYRPPFSGGIK